MQFDSKVLGLGRRGYGLDRGSLAPSYAEGNPDAGTVIDDDAVLVHPLDLVDDAAGGAVHVFHIGLQLKEVVADCGLVHADDFQSSGQAPTHFNAFEGGLSTSVVGVLLLGDDDGLAATARREGEGKQNEQG